MKQVAELYDTLLHFEGKNQDAPYPIHKRLVFNDSSINDIYDWLINRHQFSEHTHILDAGCGVGFGSLLIARRTSAQVTGISISPLEIQRARQNAKQAQLEDNVHFDQASFEDLDGVTFDYIIAIESLKHSLQLEKALTKLKSYLKDQGQLIIIEDFYSGNSKSHLAKRLVDDWHLKTLYTITDFERPLGENLQYTDLTQYMPKKSKVLVSVRLFFLSMISFLTFWKMSAAFKIFRGGICLDVLYNRKEMKYGCLIYKKTDHA